MTSRRLAFDLKISFVTVVAVVTYFRLRLKRRCESFMATSSSSPTMLEA